MPTLAEAIDRLERVRADTDLSTADDVKDAVGAVIESLGDLDQGMFELAFEGAVNKQMRPFVLVTTPGDSAGISVQDTINLAMRAIMAAQEAERDVALMKAVMQMSDDLDPEEKRAAAAQFLAVVRHFRAQADPGGEGGKESPDAAAWTEPGKG